MIREHTWTNIAPLVDDSTFEPASDGMWKWCLRCGCMKLGRFVYVPGPHQKLNMVKPKKDPGCGVRYGFFNDLREVFRQARDSTGSHPPSVAAAERQWLTGLQRELLSLLRRR